LEWKPQSVSYLYDGTGMFRGMAFVKYKEIEQATKVFNAINNMDINSRKLRVEYKRKVAEAEVEDNATKLYDQLNTFRQNNAITELAFPCGSSFQVFNCLSAFTITSISASRFIN
jgi:RNA recognition motif-containing protein